MADKEILSFAAFLGADGVDYETVEVRGGTVRVGSLSAEEFTKWTIYRDVVLDGKDLPRAQAMLICESLVDDKGKRIGDQSQLEALMKMNMRSTERLLKAIFRLNGVGAQAEAEAKKD